MEGTVAIGVETHKHVHVAVALDRCGAQLGSREVATPVAPATKTFIARLLSFALFPRTRCPWGAQIRSRRRIA